MMEVIMALFPFMFMGVFFLIGILGMIFMVWMLIDCVQRKFKKDNDRVIWVLIIVFLNWIGALVYYFVIKRNKKV